MRHDTKDALIPSRLGRNLLHSRGARRLTVGGVDHNAFTVLIANEVHDEGRHARISQLVDPSPPDPLARPRQVTEHVRQPGAVRRLLAGGQGVGVLGSGLAELHGHSLAQPREENAYFRSSMARCDPGWTGIGSESSASSIAMSCGMTRAVLVEASSFGGFELPRGELPAEYRRERNHRDHETDERPGNHEVVPLDSCAGDRQ